jgi:Asp-tRNA(Asn)/Glu-tRNA(Gln) amidotransferase C subunit
MVEEITKDIFAKLVSLAALELNPDEGEYLRGQLNKQLLAVHELESMYHWRVMVFHFRQRSARNCVKTPGSLFQIPAQSWRRDLRLPIIILSFQRFRIPVWNDALNEKNTRLGEWISYSLTLSFCNKVMIICNCVTSQPSKSPVL